MKRLWELIVRLLTLVGLLRPEVPRVPPIPPVPAPAYGATMAVLLSTIPVGPTGLRGPTGPTGATGSTGPVGPVGKLGWDVSVPAGRETSAVLPIMAGYLVEFQSFAYGSRSSEGIMIVSKVGIWLSSPGGRVLVSEAPALSLNTRAASLPWVASIVESKLAELRVSHPPLDMELLEEASKTALKAAMEHSLSVAAHYLVERIEPARVTELWKEAVVRYVMES